MAGEWPLHFCSVIVFGRIAPVTDAALTETACRRLAEDLPCIRQQYLGGLLGIVLANFVPLPLSAITMILNVVLLIIGFFYLRAGIRRQDRLHQCGCCRCLSGMFERLFPDSAR